MAKHIKDYIALQDLNIKKGDRIPLEAIKRMYKPSWPDVSLQERRNRQKDIYKQRTVTGKLVLTDDEYDWFHSNITVDHEGHWIWTGKHEGQGYGRTRFQFSLKAHRTSYEVHKGLAGDLLVCHTCDIPECVNPDHLFLGTHKDNMQDRIKKGLFSKKKTPIIDIK